MITSKLTTKAQTTIPQAVRSALHLKEGDEIAYTITGDKVVMTKAELALWLMIPSPPLANGTARRIGKPMPPFKQGDVVRVPFPYADRATRQHRPALVVSTGGVGENGNPLWVVMITSAENRAWPGDLAIGRYEEAGLPAPSFDLVRIATIEARHAERLVIKPR